MYTLFLKNETLKIKKESYIHIFKMNYHYLLKYIIIGESGVGKSSLLLQFADKRFKPEQDITIGVEFGVAYTTVDKINIKIQIWDTAGQELFRSLTRSYYRGAAATILVFDITKRSTFLSLRTWLIEARQAALPSLVVIIVGNKSDVEYKRQVTNIEATQFANELGLVYIETSAQTGINVDKAFQTCAIDVLKRIQGGEIDVALECHGVKVGNTVFDNDKNNQTNISQRRCC